MKNVSQHGAATDANRPLTDYRHVGFCVCFISRCLLAVLLLTALTGCAPKSGPSLALTAVAAQSPNLARPSREAEKALYHAAGRGDIRTVKKLLAAGVNPNFAVPMGGSPVEEAAEFSRLDAVRLLLAHMPEASAEFKRHYVQAAKNSALREAVKARSLRRVKILVAAGADVNDGWDGGPLSRAIADSEKSIPILRFLLARGANVNRQNRRGETPLIQATLCGSEVVALLLSRGAKVNVRDRQGWTALMYAAQDGAAASVRLLLAHGGNPNLQNKDRQTALMLASYRNETLGGPQGGLDFTPQQARIRLAKVRLLRRSGADPRLQDKRGKKASDYRHMNFYDGPAS